MLNNINKPTYLIAELEGDVVELVRTMRERFNPDNVLWPADITIAGSSGVGPFKYGQSLEEVIQHITPVLSEFKFTEVTFTGIDRFPNTGIYYLKPERTKFDQMHQAIKSTPLEFDPIEWPYNPHCTLHWKDKNTAELDKLFSTIEAPEYSAINCFSLYQPEKRGGNRLHRF